MLVQILGALLVVVLSLAVGAAALSVIGVILGPVVAFVGGAVERIPGPSRRRGKRVSPVVGGEVRAIPTAQSEEEEDRERAA